MQRFLILSQEPRREGRIWQDEEKRYPHDHIHEPQEVGNDLPAVKQSVRIFSRAGGDAVS